MYAACVVALFVTLAIGEAIPVNNVVTAPKRCCPPELYQADIRITQGLSIGGKGMGQYLRGHMWFDRQNNTNAFDGMMILNGQRSKLNFVQAAKKQYIINKEKRECKISNNPFPDFNGCIPEGAMFVGQETLGDKLVVDTWMGNLKDDTYNVNYEFTVTPDCIPVTANSMGEVDADWGKTSLTTSSRVSNVKEGIKDFSVFSIPDYCEK